MSSETVRRTDVLVVGGGCGGVAAVLSLVSKGVSCILTEPTDWLGGQLTSQGVPPDEHRWIEGDDGFFGATRRYVAFRGAVRSWYRRHGRLSADARADRRLNPGGGWVSRLCFDPAVGERVLRDMLQPHIECGRLEVLCGANPVRAELNNDRVASVVFRTATGVTSVDAKYVLDATEFGDLYPLVGCRFMLGAEGSDVFGEMHGRGDLGGSTDPADQQAISWCFALEHCPGEDHTIDQPASYESWRSFVPELTPPWPGPLFSWDIDDATDPRHLPMIPPPDEPAEGELELWRYRRLVAGHLHDPPKCDVSLWNIVQTDYFRRPAIAPGSDPYLHRDDVLAEAKEQARCFVRWLQTDAPRHDDGHGYPELKLAGDCLGTSDGFAKAVYVREPRRLLAETILTEKQVGIDQRVADGVDRPGLGERFADSVGIGHYMIDLHPTAAGRNSVYVKAAPFEVPLGALLPKAGQPGSANLIAAGKAIGVSHVANGCTRLHPVEWTIGEAAGSLAAWCLARDVRPHEVRENLGELQGFQASLADDGVELSWPDRVAEGVEEGELR
ncbi:MAG: FAD-dependent oxidoreductase [Planctomycetota bacterium]